MENENINNDLNPVEDEALQNDVPADSTESAETPCETPEVDESLSDEDCSSDYEGCQADGEQVADTLPELTEEELAAIAELKRKKRKKGFIIAGIIVAFIAIMAYFVCAIEGVGSNTIVANPISETEETKENTILKAIKFDNIKYENPIVAAFDKITGRNQDIALTINGQKVNKDLFNFVVNSSGINNVYTLVQMQLISDINDFDWNKIEEQSGLSYLELSKGMAVETLMPMYALIAEGEKKGIVLDENDEKKISDWLEEQKKKYGNTFEDVVKKSGYEDVETLANMQRLQLHIQKIYEDVSKDPSKYLTEKQKKAYFSDDKVTVKHILIQFEKDENGAVTDSAKAAAKAKAEEVLAKVKAGEDFDKLIKEYNQDPGASEQGYTFANDGSMVQAFADASFALEIGQTSELVETPYGYHIIKRLERNITADDYIEVLSKTADVRIKKGVYDNMKITINLKDFFGEPATEESADAE